MADEIHAVHILTEDQEKILQQFLHLGSWARRARECWLRGDEDKMARALEVVDEVREKLRELTGK